MSTIKCAGVNFPFEKKDRQIDIKSKAHLYVSSRSIFKLMKDFLFC